MFPDLSVLDELLDEFTDCPAVWRAEDDCELCEMELEVAMALLDAEAVLEAWL